MSHEEQTDLRIQRTHKFLQEAMIELITEKGFDAAVLQKREEDHRGGASPFCCCV